MTPFVLVLFLVWKTIGHIIDAVRLGSVLGSIKWAPKGTQNHVLSKKRIEVLLEEKSGQGGEVLFLIAMPNVDPVAIYLGPIKIYWCLQL